jgi:PAP2 superfamily
VIRGAFSAGLRNDWPALVVVIAAWVASALALISNGVNPIRWTSYLNNLEAYGFWFGIYIVYRLVRVTLTDRPERPIRHFFKRLTDEGWPKRLLENLPLIFALAVFMPMFSAMKSAIPVFESYSWDSVFIEWDRAIHGGDPWLHLQPILGHPAITATLSALYTAWVLLIYVGSLYFCFFARSELVRQQYFLTYFLAWSLLGIVAAQYFASLGPCFLHIITNDETFVGQILYLNLANDKIPIVSLNVQEILVRAYYARNYELGSGITAMPSMHVALCTLFYLGMRQQSRKLALLSAIYGLIILVSSVHLGFHYAIDGYASIVGVAFLWWLSGRFLRTIGHHTRAPQPSELAIDATKPALDRWPGRRV